MGKKYLLMTFLVAIIGFCGTSLSAQNVAKVGNTEYATIDKAIAAWTNNTTLTLLADVTLSDVVTIKSTEHHILNLGTYTMTAASGKNAFVIQACGTGSAERYAITINADATEPGGINAGSKCVIYYKYADGGISTEDRPIIKINGGVFTGSTSSFGTAGIYTIGTAARKCATLNISGGTFNCSINGSGKSKLIVSGGVFNYSVGSQGDSTASRLISGGTFKTLGFMTADSNNTKFWIGTSMGNSNVGVHVDDNGYIVVGGPVVTEAGESFEASSANYSGASSYLQYSSAKDNGLYYTSVEEAFADNNKASGSVTVYVDELDMADISYKGTIVVPEGEKITIVTAAGVTPTWTVSANNDAVTYTDAEGNELVKDENGSFVVPPVAKIGETSYETLQAAVDAVQDDQTITLLADAAEDVIIPAGVTFNGNGKAVGNITAAGTITFNGYTKATSFNVENTNTTINIDEGACLEITGSGRMVIGHGCTFNITGSIADNAAKTADKATLTPSLVMPGASFTGAGVTFNVTNAYISAPFSYCSSSKTASGTFDFNITNSIWDSAGKLAFEAQSTAAKVDFALVNSVLTTGSHLVFGTASGEEGVVIDNSLVNQGTSRQIENRGTMTIKNGAVVNGAVATSSNAINPGTIIVENATYAVTGEFSGAAVGTGNLIIKKGANVSVGSIKAGANVTVDAEGMAAGDEINFTADLSQFTGTLSVINNDKLEASIVDGKIVLAERPAAKIGNVEYTTLEAAFKAATSGCTIDILSDVTVDYNWDARNTGGKFTVPVTINGNGKTIKFTASVNDNNYQAPFRFEKEATVNNLTVDMSKVTDVRFRAISSKDNLTVDGCKFIGKDETLNCRAIIFGEGAGANVGNLAIAITNSEFINWKRGITDNENAQDVKTVTITGNTLTDAGVGVSAKETVTFTGNTVSGAYVNIKSYTAGNKLAVTATGNTLEANTENAYNVINAGGKVEADDAFNVVAKGNDFTGYTRADAIWGEVWGNARESFVIKVLDANGNVMGTTSLNNVNGIIDGDVNVTWNIKLDAASNTDEYWTMAWTTAPTIDNMPAKVELWVDGVKVSGGNVVLNGPDNLNKIYAAVTDNTGKILGYYTDIQDAIKAAAAVTSVARTATAGTVEVLSDVTVDKWIMFAEKLTIGDGSLITLNINGVTIDGNGKTLTVKSIESAGNGNRLFYDAQNLTVKDLTINIADGLVGGIGLQSGTISNVTFNGGQYGVLPGKNGVTVSGCTFNDTKSYAVYYEDERPGIVVDGNTFNTADGAYAITMRSNEQFTNNTITKGRVNLANSAASTVSGNDFGTERFKVYNGATATISDNKINNLVFSETNVPTESTFTNNTLSTEAQAAIDALPAIAGEGTEANPYLINNVDDLVWLQEKVDESAQDGSTQFAGKYFKLTNDIDLSGINWNPIGTMSADHGSFKGVFDGGDHTISNLHVEQAGNGIGLFARTTGNAVIKNLKLNNVTVESTDNSNYVGGLVGNAYASTKIENVHVSGNVYISGRGYIGGIAGHGYVVMDNVSVVATGDGKGNNKGLITSTFWCAGGVLGYAGEGATNIMNAHVENVVVTSAAGGLGAIVGMAEDNNGTQPISGSNLSAENVDIKTYTGAYGDAYANYALGYLYGGNPTSILTGDLSVDNVIITTSNGVAPEVTDAVAQIGNSIYFNLQDALNAGGNVTVLRDIALVEGVTVAADKTVVLDLNGKTITGTPAEAKAFAVITNKGDLTITDGTETEGKIVCDHKLVGSTNYAVNTITNSGTLKIAAGTIQNTSTASNQIGYAIDNNSTTGNTILVIEGGEVTASGSGYYDGIRQFCNSETNENSVTIIDGEVSSLWLQNPSDGSGTQNTKDVKGSFAINGGTLNNLYLEPSAKFAGAIIGGHVGNISRFQTAEGRDLEGFISGGTFSSDVSEFCAKGFVCNDNGNGTYGVVEKSAVAKIGDVEYKYIQDAIDAANASDVINVVSSTTENITIAENDNITLTFSEGVTLNGYFAPFKGNLTINGGTINNTNSGASAIEINAGKLNLNGVNIASARHAVRIDGTVTATIDGGEYTLTATSGTRHAVNVSGSAEVTIKAGTFVGPKGTTMDSGSAVCVRAGAKVTIEGGDFSKGKNATLGVTGTMIVTGGTFDQDPSAYLAQGYITKYNETTSRYEVFKGVAKIENEYFASIQDAIDAAENDDVIKVLNYIYLSDDKELNTLDGKYNTYFKVEDKTVTIDLNGKIIYVEYSNPNMLVGVFSTENNGHLTLMDSSNGTGSVDVVTKGNGVVYSLIANYESGCSITINGGTYKLDKASDSHIYSGCGCTNEGTQGVTVNGGVFYLGNVATGSNGSPWIFNVKGQNNGHVKVFGGTYNYNVFNQHWIFEAQTSKEYAIRYDGDETWTVVPAVAWVNNRIQSGSKYYTYELGYTTLAEAIAAAEDCNEPNFTETVTLLQDITLENTITVNAGRDVILDLKGKTISGVCNSGQGHMFMVQNTADLTVKDSSENEEGKIIYSRGTSNTGWVIDLEGDLILESGTIELTGDSWSIGYAVDVRPNSWGSEYTEATTFTMSGGKLVSSDAAVRVASSSADNHENVSANFIMNGGEIEAAWDGIFVQQSNAAYDILNVRINGGNIKSALSPLRLYGPAATSVLNNVENPITLNITGGTFDYTGNDLENNKWLVPGVIMVAGGATFEQMLGYTDFEITGGTFEGDVNDYCAEGFAATNNDNGTWTVMPAQEQHLVAGWNWYSSYIDINGVQGLKKIENALGTNGIQILGHEGFTLYDSELGWYGPLVGTGLDVKKMYKIEVGEGGVDMRIAGNIVDFTNETIEIKNGFNWISYPFNQPMNLNDALKDFTPAEGDYIVSHFSFAFYYDNQWQGSLESFTPGEGYIYERIDVDTELSYNVSNTRGAVKANVTTDGNKWMPNGRLYPNNMTMIAVVDGLANANYEVAAFVNGELRGSARPIYIESLDAYMLFLTIHGGDEVEEMSFRLYDIDNNTEYDLSDRINYSNNAHLGSVNEPYVFSRGTTGIGEASMSNVNIYPNPTTTGTEINLEATCDKVEVFNALGVKVAEYQNVDTIDALETAGIYVIRITNNGNVQNCRLVVK